MKSVELPKILGIFCPDKGVIRTIMKHNGLKVCRAHYPIKLGKIWVTARSSSYFNQSRDPDSLTEAWNIVRCTPAISVKGNEGKVS
jgi:hypothetical protein